MWKKLFVSEYFVLYLCVLYFLIFFWISPNIASPYNLRNWLSNLLPLLIVAVGQTLVMITAGIDLSITSIVSLASVSGALVMTGDQGWLTGGTAVPAAIGVMMGTGLLIGSINGLAVTRFDMPPFIVTLTTLIFIRGFAIWMTQSNNIFNLPPSFNQIAQGSWVGIPYAGWITLAVVVAAMLFLSRSLVGRWIYAVGDNPQTALISGVPVKRTLGLVYALSGLCGGIAAILYTARLETGSPTMGDKILLDVIGATVLGGTSLFGGKGKIQWTIYGVLLISLIDNTLNMVGLSFSLIILAKGLVILLAALMDAVRNRMLAVG